MATKLGKAEATAGSGDEQIGMTGRASGPFGGLSVATAPKVSGEGNFGRFLTDLEAFFAFDPSLNDEQRLRFLPLCLTAVARDAFDSLTDGQRATFRDAVDGLKGFFHRPNSVDAHSQLRSLKFEPRQHHSFDVFLIKFKKLVHEAFPGSVSDIVMFNCFLDAVPERYKVDIVSQGVTTFTDAVERTRNVMRGEQLCADRTPGDNPVRQLISDEPSVLSQILARLEQLERRVTGADMSGRTASGRGTVRGGRGPSRARDADVTAPAPRSCFVCGSVGHLRRNCRFRNHTCYGCGETGHLVNRCPKASSNAGNDQGGLVPGIRGPRDSR